MAGSVFNVAKGRGNELHDRVVNGDPGTSALVVVLLQSAEYIEDMTQRSTLAEVLSASGTEEADFTNYSRATFSGWELSPSTVDMSRRYCTVPNPTWLSAGGATNNSITHLLVCYASATFAPDEDVTPLVVIPFDVTTDGNDLTAFMDPAGYFEAY